MSKIKILFLTFFLIVNLTTASKAQGVPASFADLAEKLMPSVVNISTTQTIVILFQTFNSLLVLPLKTCLRNLEFHKKDSLQP